MLTGQSNEFSQTAMERKISTQRGVSPVGGPRVGDLSKVYQVLVSEREKAASLYERSKQVANDLCGKAVDEVEQHNPREIISGGLVGELHNQACDLGQLLDEISEQLNRLERL